VHALADGATDLTAVRTAALAGLPRPTTTPTLEWLGRKAFDARYGNIPGLDHDYGMRWGTNGNQRVSFRRRPGATKGMLYAYDPTWDEYAVCPPRAATQHGDDTTARPSDDPRGTCRRLGDVLGDGQWCLSHGYALFADQG
jgi:hypothetical protein